MKKRLVSIMLLGSILGSNITGLLPVFAEGTTEAINNIDKYEFSKEVLNKLNETEALVRTAETSKNIQDLDKAIVAFIDINNFIIFDDIEAHRDGDKFDDLYFRIREILYNLPKDVRNDKIVDFEQRICNALIKKTDSFFKEYLFHIDYANTIPEIKDKLIAIVLQYNKAIMEVDGPDNGLSDETDKDNGLIPDAPDLSDIGKPTPQPPTYITEGQSVEYKPEGKNCYKVTTYYVDGKIKNVKRENATKSEYVFCSIFDYVDFGGGVYQNGNGNQGGLYGDIWGYINQTQNPESNMTLQFTIEKDGDRPYYFDTGIRTALDGTVSYEQLKDVVYQVAVKSKGYVVDDKNKILAIMEGKPLVFRNTKAKYTKADIETIFSGFTKVDVRIMETRIGKSESLEERIVGKQARNVKVDGKEIELIANPIVKDNRVLLPIEQVASELGAIVKKSEGTLIVIKDSVTVEYKEKKSILLINGQNKEITTSPEYKDGYFMAEAQDMADALGYDMNWDGEASTIIFSKR